MDPFKPYHPSSRTVVPKLSPSDAEAVALKAVAWIVADDAMLSRFMALTGCGGGELRQRIEQPAFLGAVLDFMLGDQATVLAFTAYEGLAPEVPMLARAKLP